MEMSGQPHTPTALHSGNGFQYAVSRKRGGPRSRSGLFRAKGKTLFLTGLEPRTVHAVESRYNDYVLPNRKKIIKSRNT
jgi:hypothetical protein